MAKRISPSLMDAVVEMFDKELDKAIKGMQAAIDNNYKYEYDKYKKQIEEYHKKLTGNGAKLPPMTLPKWGESSAKNDSRRPSSPKEPSLRDLTTKPTNGPTAKPLKKSVGKATDMVAGRTGKQIEAAKRAQSKRLGQSGAAGKSKRCKKGKSCGATCINGSKVCLVDIPWASSSGIPKVVKEIQNRETKPKAKEEKPPAKPPAKPSSKPKLSEMETSTQFRDKLNATWGGYSPVILQMHDSLNKLIGPSVGTSPAYENSKQEGKYADLRAKLLKALGNGDEGKGASLVKFAYDALKTFTGSYSGEIREAQMGITPNDKFLRMAKALEKLINSPEVPRPAVEKFRGIRVDSRTLQGMIETAKTGGSFDGRALASWSTSLKTSKIFADEDRYDGKNDRVIFRAINSRGVPINTLSSLTNEFEVLTSGSANYKYLNYRVIKEGGDTYHVFDVEES